MTKTADSDCDVCVVGGAGHVGVALALILADSGFKTLVLDVTKRPWKQWPLGVCLSLSKAAKRS